MNPRHIGADVIGGEAPNGFHLDVRARGFELTPAIYQYAVDHIAAKLTKHTRMISEVIVRLEDVNGPKHGLDKSCRVEVLLAGTHPLVVGELDQDARAAMDAAGHRIELLVGRELEHRRTTRRQRGRKIVRNRKLFH